jgi:hypothetical protein
MSFFFLVGQFVVVVLIAVRVHLGEFERLRSDNFKLGATLIADHDVTFFNFLGIKIENAFAFLTDWHSALLSRSIKNVDVTATQKRRLG